HRHRQATATATVTVTVMATIVGHGMGVPRGGRFGVETAHLTKVRAVVAGTPGMDARPVTRYRVETAHPTDLEGEAGSATTKHDIAKYRQYSIFRCVFFKSSSQIL